MNLFGMRSLLKKIKREIKLSRLNAVWRKKNKSNKTVLEELCDINSVKVGHGTYGRLKIYDFDYVGNENVRLTIGNYCSIARDVVFLTAGEHPLDRVSTFPFRSQYIREAPESTSKGPIVIDDDVDMGH